MLEHHSRKTEFICGGIGALLPVYSQGAWPHLCFKRCLTVPQEGKIGVRNQEERSQNQLQCSHIIILCADGLTWGLPLRCQLHKALLYIFWALKILGGKRKMIMLQITGFFSNLFTFYFQPSLSYIFFLTIRFSPKFQFPFHKLCKTNSSGFLSSKLHI